MAEPLPHNLGVHPACKSNVACVAEIMNSIAGNPPLLVCASNHLSRSPIRRRGDAFDDQPQRQRPFEREHR